MMTHSLLCEEASSVSRMIELLNELHDALEENAYTEEANVVRNHIAHLKSAQTEELVFADGIDKVMEELAEGFAVL